MFCLIHDLLLLIRSEGPVPNKLPVASCVESWMCLYSWHLAEGATPFVMYKEYVWGSLFMQDGAQEIATSIFVIGDWSTNHNHSPERYWVNKEHVDCIRLSCDSIINEVVIVAEISAQICCELHHFSPHYVFAFQLLSPKSTSPVFRSSSPYEY